MESSRPTHAAVDALVARAHGVRYADLALAASLSEQAVQQAKVLGYTSAEIRAQRLLGLCYGRLDRFTEAATAIDTALALLTLAPDEAEHGRVLGARALSQGRQGHLPDAMQSVLASLAILAHADDREAEAEVRSTYGLLLEFSGDVSGALEQLSATHAHFAAGADPAALAAVLCNIALIHGRIGDPQRSYDLMLRAVALLEPFPNNSLRSALHCNIASNLGDRGDFDAAFVHAHDAVTFARQGGGPSAENWALHNLAELHLKKGESDAAIRHLQSSLALAVAVGLRAREAFVRSMLGKALLAKGEHAAALEELTSALALAEELGLSRTVFEVHEHLSRLHEQRGDAALALRHFQRYHETRAAVLNDQANQRVRALLVRAAVERSELEAEALRAHNEALAGANREKAALLMQLKEQSAALERLTMEDALTGISNRRHLDAQLGVELARSSRYGHALTVALVDVDHFKAVNDGYSHATGDAVIREIAQFLRRHTRNADVVARYGGEEFVVVFLETPAELGVQLCEQLRAGVAALNWSSLGDGLSITVSMGVASSTDANTAEDLLAVADARLYEAKRAGRNCVRSYLPV